MAIRWLCATCQREWIYARTWVEGEPCPVCGSEAVQRIEYRPAFPGADVPRAVEAESITTILVTPQVSNTAILPHDDEEQIYGVPV